MAGDLQEYEQWWIPLEWTVRSGLQTPSGHAAMWTIDQDTTEKQSPLIAQIYSLALVPPRGNQRTVNTGRELVQQWPIKLVDSLFTSSLKHFCQRIVLLLILCSNGLFIYWDIHHFLKPHMLLLATKDNRFVVDRIGNGSSSGSNSSSKGSESSSGGS